MKQLAVKKKGPIAFQGARGAFSEEATRKLAGANAAVLPCERFEELFLSLKYGRASGAVVPSKTRWRDRFTRITTTW